LSVAHRVRGVKVLKAVSSPLRLQILNFLFDKGPLSYTELMSSLKMNPSRDAGRFAYHLKFLLKADLIETDVETRKYCLTDLGKMVIDISDRIEKSASKSKGLLVRASRFALEEFDANRIAVSLVREGKMSAELAQRVAKEAERRLLKSKTKYLTAPLVREVVNAILIERGLEEYRHKLTRLGLPVHEVTLLLEARSPMSQDAESIRETAGDAVVMEYMLLKAFPRDIADAHLAGLLHIDKLSSWTMKPSEIVHDIRFFFQHGINLEKINAYQLSFSAPGNFDSALNSILNVLIRSAREIAEAQTVEYFNVFLAPFAKGVDPQKTKEALDLFISNASQLPDISLGLEVDVPDFVADKPALGSHSKQMGKYGDFEEETQLLASLILDVLVEHSQSKPLLNPKIIVKMRSKGSANERAKALLLKAHRLVLENGPVYFSSLQRKEEEQSVFSGLGRKFTSDLNGDWETDTLRTGCSGSVAVNLPRIAYESEKDESKFVGLLRERLEMAVRALEIKFAALKQRGSRLLPFVMQRVNGDEYFRLEDSSHLINLIGLDEALEWFCGKNYPGDKASQIVDKLSQCILDSTQRARRRQVKRLLPSLLPDTDASERLAQMDIDRYGFGKVKYSGTRERPFYSAIKILRPQLDLAPQGLESVKPDLSKLLEGGGLTVIELGDTEQRPDDLMSLSEKFAEGHSPAFFAYGRKFTYCTNCKKSWKGMLHKCPSCSSTGTLTVYDTFAYK
jgi:anaerobic ribonucleoside-triphosphate reductase